MKVKFINIGARNANFIKEYDVELNYEWLLKQVRPYLLSPNIGFNYNKKRNNNCVCRDANSWRNRGGTIKMSKNLLGKHVVTYDNHEGIIINQYKPTGRNQESVHIQQRDGRIWFCPIDNIKMEV